MRNKHAAYKTVKEKRLSSADERLGGRGGFSRCHTAVLQGVEEPAFFFFFFLQEDEKILLKPKGSAIIFGQLER